MINKKPNVFIVGAAKAGTISLWYILKQHEEIFMSEDEQGNRGTGEQGNMICGRSQVGVTRHKIAKGTPPPAGIVAS